MRASRNPYHQDAPSQLFSECQPPCSPQTAEVQNTTTNETNNTKLRSGLLQGKGINVYFPVHE